MRCHSQGLKTSALETQKLQNPRDICPRDKETANPRERKEDFSFFWGGTNLPTYLPAYLLAGGNDDCGTFKRKTASDSEADSLRGSGDNCHLPFQPPQKNCTSHLSSHSNHKQKISAKKTQTFFITKSGFLLYSRRLPSPPCSSAPQLHRKNCAIARTPQLLRVLLKP